MTIPPETRAAQLRATDPAASAWVAANAGSGKTYVLTRRVIRLLLAGCEPSRILCLTFTKAAAAEMANRVFTLLGQWAVLPEAALAAELEQVEGHPPDARRLAAARRLFARALETPGGLKIQTIHAFCEALLQRFPVEADLPGRFEVLDERRAAALLAEARATAIREATASPGSPLGAALALLLSRQPDHAIDAAIDGFVRRREAVLDYLRRFDHLDAAVTALPEAFGAPAGRTRDDLVAELAVSPLFGPDVLAALVPLLDRQSKTMVDLADRLRAAIAESDPPRRAEIWREAFLTKKDEPRSSPVTKAVEAALPGTSDRFASEAARILDVEGGLLALDTAVMTAAALRLADRVIGHYQASKRAEGALDFDDLIQRTVTLLSRADAADWVQYKLDEGLDHVLVDEAQDTSPLQWRIVQALTGEFFAGAGARGATTRTVFAVGDEKQSIYSFQGADPRQFADAGRGYETKGRDAGTLFHQIALHLSFRSTPDVVKAVDAVFSTEAAYRGLSRDPAPTVHETRRVADLGLVEIWPEVEAEETPAPPRWQDPVDVDGPGTPEVRLARRIAAEIRGWIDRGETIEATGEPIRPKDVIVLVRKRGAFVEALNRALRTAGIAVAGADRLDVVGHIVAEDALAAARVALLPDDDLTLAAFARSPLVPAARPGDPAGLSEDALFRLAHGRKGVGLWDAVQAAAAEGDPDAVRLADRVMALSARADRFEPFGFFALLFGADGGRAAFRARFGREADEVVDEFLALALAMEDRGAGGLATFVAQVREAREEIRREVDASRDEVRVMTVHGAKGLEAKVVFLVDPGSPPVSGAHDPVVGFLDREPGSAPVWIQSGRRPPRIEAVIANHRREQEEEYRRLLYVGLTRAADRLIVCGTKGRRSKPDGRWHTLVTDALGSGAEAVAGPDGSVERLRWRATRPIGPGRLPKPAGVTDAVPAAVPEVLPDFLSRPPPGHRALRSLTPSSAAALLGGPDATDHRGAPAPDALARARGVEQAAARRGRLLHRLVELLPEVAPDARRSRAASHLDRFAGDLAPEDRTAILAAVFAVLDDPGFAPVFGPGSRAEVAIVGELPVGNGPPVRVFGQIDRLVSGPDGMMIVDFKTDRIVPDRVREAYATQLALYRAVLSRLSPGVPIRAAILWTSAPRLDEVDPVELDGLVTHLVTNMGSPPPGARP